jgi:hypothetical protein
MTGRELVCGELDPALLAVSGDQQRIIRAEVIRDILVGRHVKNPGPHGLRLTHARITGSLDLDRLTPIMGLALSFCVLDHPITMRGCHLPWLTLSGSHLPGIVADGVLVDGAAEFIGTRVSADSDSAAVAVSGAYIRGVFDCSGASVINKSGPALVADNLKVDGSLDFARLEAEANCGSGAVQLVRALVGGSMRGDFAVLVNKSGPSFSGDNLRVSGPFSLSQSKCLGNHPLHGVVGLHGADTGNVEFDGATVINESGSALVATRLRADGTVSFRDGFHAAGRDRPTLDLDAAQIAGGLDFAGSRLLNRDGLALNLASATVKWICLPDDAICRSGPEDDGTLRLDGFTYSALDPRGADLGRWLTWLRSSTPAYTTQPYQQLAALYRAAGNEVAARRVLIAQQDDLLTRGELGGHWAKAWHRLKKLAVGYGYQSWRALIGLIIVVILGAALGLTAGHIRVGPGRFGAVHSIATGHSGTPCSIVEQVGLGLDLSLPAINTGLSNSCSLDSASRAGQVITVIAWIFQGIGWALATLVIAGYTGLIRKV